MKRLFLLAIAVLFGSVLFAGLMIEDPGYVLFSYRNTTVETSLWIGILLVLAMVLFTYVALRLLALLLNSTSLIKHWWEKRGHRRSAAKTTHGMIDLMEGNYQAAQKKLSQAAQKSDTPLVNYLAAARAAAENEDNQATEELLSAAKRAAPSAELAVSLARTEILIQRAQFEQALALLLQNAKHYPKHKQIHRLLQQVYLELGDWEALGRLMPMLRKLKVAPLAQLDEIEQKTLLMLIKKVVAESSSAADRAERLREVWSRAQAKVRRREYVTLAYVNSVRALGKNEWAVPAIYDAVQQQWSDALVDIYGRIAGQDVQGQLKNAESWIKAQPNNAVLMLALGRVSMRNKLWGKAREYYVASITLKKSPLACAELARLLEHLGEEQSSAEQMQQGFAALSDELPDLPLPEPRRGNVANLVTS